MLTQAVNPNPKGANANAEDISIAMQKIANANPKGANADLVNPCQCLHKCVSLKQDFLNRINERKSQHAFEIIRTSRF